MWGILDCVGAKARVFARRLFFAGVVTTAALLCAIESSAAQTATPTFDFPVAIADYIGVVLEERNLDLPVPPVPDVATLNVQEALTFATNRNDELSELCGFPVAPWLAIGSTITAVGDTSPQCAVQGTIIDVANAEHREYLTVVGVLIDNSSGSGDVAVRALGFGLNPFEIEAVDLDSAHPRVLRAAYAQAGRRYHFGDATVTGGGPVVVSDRVLSQRLTGQDVQLVFVEVIGSNNGQPYIIGTRVDCPTALSTVGCTGGVTSASPSGFLGNNYLIYYNYITLYITTTVERTLTGGTTFFDVELTPLPSGAVHAAFANAGFLVTDRFLRRLTDGPAEAALGRGAVWSEAWTSQSSFDGQGVLGATDIDSFGFAGGAVVRPWEHWTLGIAGEYGESDLSIADALTPEAGEASHLRIGAHAFFARGPFHASAAAMIGAFDVDTIGSSTLGVARADYDATISGASLEAGYDIGAGALLLTPHVGASLLSWERDGFSETGGPAPLTLATEDESQTRVWAGLNMRWAPDLSEGRLAVNAYARAVSISGDARAHVTAFDPQLPGEPFVVAGPDFGDNAAEFGASLDYRLGERTRIEAAYDGRVGDSFDEHAGRVTLRMAF